jgi:sulfur relay (sulfurtransferase) DsrC/TusE family protein
VFLFLAVKQEFTKELCIKFSEETYDVVQEVANKLFEGNKSQAVRYIIKQYKQYTTRKHKRYKKQVINNGGAK